jgi:CBS domain-containing protein
MKTTDTVEQVLKQKAVNKVLSVDSEQTVWDALQVMAENDVGALLVLSKKKLAGIFSERDYARKCVLLGHHSKETKVSEIMTSSVTTVTPQNTVDECMTLMTERHIRHLPVMEGDKVIGIVSVGDMVKWVITGQEQVIEALQSYIAGSYPG